MTVSGYGFSQNTTVTIGSVQCDVIEVNLYQLLCRVPAVSKLVLFKCDYGSYINYDS